MPFKKRSFGELHTSTTLNGQGHGQGGQSAVLLQRHTLCFTPRSKTLAKLLLDWDESVYSRLQYMLSQFQIQAEVVAV